MHATTRSLLSSTVCTLRTCDDMCGTPEGDGAKLLKGPSPCVVRLTLRQDGVPRRRDYGPTTRPCEI
eukprot:516683-Pyramimonas_sp.AAC.1